MSEEPKPKRIMRFLTLEERQQIEAFLKNDLSYCRIAKKLNRPFNTIYSEIVRNGGRDVYKAEDAESNVFKLRKLRSFSVASSVQNKPASLLGLKERLKTLEFAFQSLFEIVKELKQLNQKESP